MSLRTTGSIGLGSIASLALAAALVTGGCGKSNASSEPEAGAGPEVIVEDPGEAPVEPAPDPDPDPGQDPAGDEPPGGTTITKTTVACQSDADCVQDSCCHATSCVAPADAPNCSQTMCTMDCQAGTMDCFGGCLCQDGYCAAEVWNGNAPPSP